MSKENLVEAARVLYDERSAHSRLAAAQTWLAADPVERAKTAAHFYAGGMVMLESVHLRRLDELAENARADYDEQEQRRIAGIPLCQNCGRYAHPCSASDSIECCSGCEDCCICEWDTDEDEEEEYNDE